MRSLVAGEASVPTVAGVSLLTLEAGWLIETAPCLNAKAETW
jgi:hypothetical protein